MTQKQFLGVCAWFVDKFDLNVVGIKMLFFSAVILALGSPILIYFILYFLKPNYY
tara:strand:- start:317 stop:481 length:165 start_codon:yes stop_codon:yes gene_type:complete